MKLLRRTVIVIHDDGIDTVLMNQRTIVATSTSSMDEHPVDQAAWRSAMARCLAEVHGTIGRAQASVILALASTQVRTIDGLPQTSDRKVLRQIIASSPFRYVPRRFSNPITSNVIVRKPGEVTVAFVNLDTVLGILQGCGDVGVHVREVSVATEPTAIPRLGSARFAIERVEQILSGAVGLPGSDWRPLALSPAPAWKPHALTTAATSVLIAAAVLAPAVRLIAASQGARQTAIPTRAVQAAQQRAMHLDSLRAPLELVRQTAVQSIRPLRILDLVGGALDDDGRILTFQADSTIVETTVTAPSLVPLLRRLEHDSHISDLTVVGGIVRDSAPNGLVERMLIRFRYSEAATRPLDSHSTQ